MNDLPKRLWAEVKREAKPNFRTLAKAQAALGIAILSYMPVRPENLAALTFGIHLFMREEPSAIPSLELSAAEVKNKETDLAYDIPPQIAKMLIEYRNRIASKVIGHRPERVFVNADKSLKSQATVAWLIRTYLKTRGAGIVLTPHQFRHLSAKTVLDAEPGSIRNSAAVTGRKISRPQPLSMLASKPGAPRGITSVLSSGPSKSKGPRCGGGKESGEGDDGSRGPKCSWNSTIGPKRIASVGTTPSGLIFRS